MRFYLLVTLVLIAGIVNAQPVVVSGAGYDGRRWILTGGNALLSFDGKSFLSLNVEGIEGIWDIAYDENLGWIIAAYAHDAGVRPRTRLLKLEGEELVDLGEIDIDIVDAIEGNGRYWLISGLGEKNARLVKFSGNGEINIGLNLSYLRQPSYLEALAWAPWDNTWLIGGATLGKGWLVSYDGEQFTDLSREAELGGLFVRTIGCNEEECLIFAFGKGRRKLLRYSPEGFSDLTSNLKIDDFVTRLTWTGSYWVLTTPSGYVIYDGGNFTSVEEFPALGTPVGEEGRWLFTGRNRVVLYNGTFLNYCSNCLRDLSVEAGLTRVKAIAPFRGGWLIATSTDGGEAGSLTLLKGNKARLLFRGKGIAAVACRSNFCLAGGKNLLLEYNGTLMVSHVNATINAISWYRKGNYWLLGAEEGLLSYNGEIRWISQKAGPVSWIACSDYCLVASDGNLLWFNGTALEDITGESGVKRTGSVREVVTLDHGDGYWLIGGNAGELNPTIWEPFLIKYDGSSSELLEGYTEGISDIEYGSVISVKWNGEYFLVYTNSGKLFRYDGRSFENLTNRYTAALKHTPNCLAWNGSTWLMGGRTGILAYDGRKIVPLHEKIKLPFKPLRKSIRAVSREAAGNSAENRSAGLAEHSRDLKLRFALPLLLLGVILLILRWRGRR